MIVVEGFFGVMNLWQNGFRCCVGVMGSSLSDAQAELIASEFKTATFLLDPDEARGTLGRQAVKKLLDRLPIRVFLAPADPDQVSQEQLKALLA